MTTQQYIQEYKDLAISEMKRMGVPAAITLAQGLLETQSGNSDLLKASNNHFGIKCKSTWTAETVTHDDDAPGECFRKYKSAEDSYRDHSNFLRGNSRYDFLFQLDPADYKAWAYGLRKAGYATNPKYPDILIKYIEDNNLEQYTMDAINDVPHFDVAKITDAPVPDSTPDSTVTSDNDSDVAMPTNLTINGAKAMYVPKGTSLLAIATQHNINLEKLLSINDLTRDGILQKSQYIFLEKKKKEGQQDFCITEPNETMYDISQKYGVILQNLYSYNQFTPDDFIVAGTKIFLKPPVFREVTTAQSARQNAKNTNLQASTTNLQPSTTNPQPSTTNLQPSTHKVLPKESLYGISKKYGVSMNDLKKWNNLTSDHIQTGQQLIISK
ncbi:MAG: glucosaminidase domain-containing protein [Ginsengibacter sp.]